MNTPAPPDKESVMDAVDQMFAEFQLLYPAQFNKAYSSPEKIGYAKKLWFKHLSHLTPEQLFRASQRVPKESEFLPTVKTVLKFCEPDDRELGLPDSHSAYLEACRAPSPKAEHHWSHPAVYHAGRDSDWFFLASTAEHQAYPVFRRHYEQLCERVRRGEALPPPVAPALPDTTTAPLSPEEQKQRMRELRRKLNI